MASILKRRKKNGEYAYAVRIKQHGKVIITKTFSRLGDARLWAQKTEAELLNSEYFPERAHSGRTVKELMARYLEQEAAHRKRPKEFAYYAKKWVDLLKNKTLSDIKPTDIARVRESLRAKYAASTVNKYLNVLNRACTLAVAEWGWMPSNPCQGVARSSEPKGRDRVLTTDERNRLLEACEQSENPRLKLFVLIALVCACRRGEVKTLKWSNVDLTNRILTLVETKNGETRSVAFPAFLADEFKRVRAMGLDDVYVFGNGQGQPEDYKKAWNGALKRAGIEGFRYHDLRHTAATNLAKSGATTLELAQITGHKTMQMLKRYTHLTENETRGPIERMSDQFFNQ